MLIEWESLFVLIIIISFCIISVFIEFTYIYLPKCSLIHAIGIINGSWWRSSIHLFLLERLFVISNNIQYHYAKCTTKSMNITRFSLCSWAIFTATLLIITRDCQQKPSQYPLWALAISAIVEFSIVLIVTIVLSRRLLSVEIHQKIHNEQISSAHRQSVHQQSAQQATESSQSDRPKAPKNQINFSYLLKKLVVLAVIDIITGIMTLISVRLILAIFGDPRFVIIVFSFKSMIDSWCILFSFKEYQCIYDKLFIKYHKIIGYKCLSCCSCHICCKIDNTEIDLSNIMNLKNESRVKSSSTDNETTGANTSNSPIQSPVNNPIHHHHIQLPKLEKSITSDDKSGTLSHLPKSTLQF